MSCKCFNPPKLPFAVIERDAHIIESVDLPGQFQVVFSDPVLSGCNYSIFGATRDECQRELQLMLPDIYIIANCACGASFAALQVDEADEVLDDANDASGQQQS